MKILLAIISFFTLTGVMSATIVDASCSQKNSGIPEIEYEINGELTKKGDTLTITIKNYQVLEPLNVTSDNPNVVKVKSIINGVATVEALVDNGVATITITAKDGQKVEIPLSFGTVYQIEVSLDRDEIIRGNGQYVTLTIENYHDLVNIQVSADPDINVNILPIVEGKVQLEAQNPWLTTITVSADNGIKKDLLLTIHDYLTVDAVLDQDAIWLDESATLTVRNYHDLENVHVNNQTPELMKFSEFNDQGQAIITPLAPGGAYFNVTADHVGVPNYLIFTIRSNKTINVDTDTSPTVGQTVTWTILNYISDLENVKISASPEGFIELGVINDQGQVELKGIKEGETIVTITADHADPLSVNLKVLKTS